jgi:hypothetical protein
MFIDFTTTWAKEQPPTIQYWSYDHRHLDELFTPTSMLVKTHWLGKQPTT